VKLSSKVARAGALAALLWASADSALAEDSNDSAYCRRVAAHARSEAALLWAPRVFAQGLRYPSGFDIGPATPTGYQVRAGLSYSLLDPFRALSVGAVADADCEAHDVQVELERALARSQSQPESVAYHAQSAFLTAQQPVIDAIVQRAQTRLKEHSITLYELNHILSLADQVERKAAQASGLAARRDALVAENAGAGNAGALTGQLKRLREVHENRLSTVRAYDAWNLRVLGGVIPLEKRDLDWFGWVELSYSLGGPFRSAAETSYREARQAELESDSHELPTAHKRQREQQLSAAEQAAVELRVIDKRLRYLSDTAQELQAADSPHTYEVDALTIERVSMEAERVYLNALIEAIKQEGNAT
jgi:hypothetical protein